MIQSVHYVNFKVLRDTVLPLGPLTLIVGPNGSGKSSALQALDALVRAAGPAYSDVARFETGGRAPSAEVSVQLPGGSVRLIWTSGTLSRSYHGPGPHPAMDAMLSRLRIYALDAKSIAAPVPLVPNIEIAPDGANLAGVLDRMRDQHPERFENLNSELAGWLPEYDRVLFETPRPGDRAIALRTRAGKHSIPAGELSHGTLLALALITLAYLSDPPSIICLEEPDRGIHPRLLKDVQDALYRLAYPERYGETRPAVQVIATTHSPYMLDLFRDHPEEIVIAQKVGTEAKFERLSDRSDLEEILQDAHLGDLWYSGIFGGVPANT